MKSKRINNGMRAELCCHIEYLAFNDKDTELKEEFIQFADECYNYRYNGEQQKYMNCVYYDKMFEVRETIVCWFSGSAAYMHMSDKRPFWFSDYDSLRKFDSDHYLTKKWLTLKEKEYKINSDKRELRSEINKVLHSVNTTKQLLEVWPECEQWIKDLGWLREEAKVPMVYPTKLNDMLCDALWKSSPTCK
ncbi:MAG: hypothetical protein DRO67_00585 [Candidatus Asgardarchaeum californiense]|nr:MAG: hypothetical protein DRO67_00585 [Candidatus Asgardarchaeum californiense]